MYSLIIKYISNLNKDQINSFAYKNNIILDENELNFLYDFIKKNSKDILANPSIFNIDRYEKKFSKENFIKIKKLYNEYLSKYRSYL